MTRPAKRFARQARGKAKAAQRTTIRYRDVVREEAHRAKRVSVDPVSRLLDAYRRSSTDPDLTIGEEQAAREIPRIYGAVVGGIFARAVNLDSNGGGGGSLGIERMAEIPELSFIYLNHYRPWAAACTAIPRPLLQVAIDYLWDEHPLDVIDRNHRWRKGTARDFLREALRRYAVAAEWMGKGTNPMPPKLARPNALALPNGPSGLVRGDILTP